MQHSCGIYSYQQKDQSRVESRSNR